MKKTAFRILSAIIVLTIASASLFSCSDASKLNKLEGNEKALAFFELIGKNADSANSYTVDIDMEMKVIGTYNNSILSGAEMVSRSVGKTILCGIHEGELYEYTKVDTAVDITFDGMEVSSTSQTDISGYKDGKMFENQKNEFAEKNLCAPISREDYLAYKVEEGGMLELEITEDICSAMTCEMMEDKSWKATYTDFTEKGLEGFEMMFEGLDVIIGKEYKIVDVELEVTATAELYPSSMKVVPVFEFIGAEEEGTAPVVTVNATFKDFNAAEPDETLDISKYTEVDDLRIKHRLERALKNMENAEEGKFSLKVIQNTKFLEQDDGSFLQDEDVIEEDKVTYKNGETYSYDIDVRTVAGGHENIFKLTYADGEGKFIHGDGEGSSKEDDSKAKAYVRGLMDPAGITTKMISEVETVDEEKGIYKIRIMNPDIEALQNTITSWGSSYVKKATAYVTVTLLDGKLTDYEYELTIEGVVNGFKLIITTVSTCKYE